MMLSSIRMADVENLKLNQFRSILSSKESLARDESIVREELHQIGRGFLLHFSVICVYVIADQITIGGLNCVLVIMKS